MAWTEVPNPKHEAGLPSPSHVVVDTPGMSYLVPMDELPWFLDRTPEERAEFAIGVDITSTVKPTALIAASTVLSIDIAAATASVVRGNVVPVITLSALARAVLARSGSVAPVATVTALARSVARGSISPVATVSASVKPIAYVTGAIVVGVELGESTPSRQGNIALDVTMQSIVRKVMAVSGALAPVATLAASVKKVMSNAGGPGVVTTLSAASSKVSASAGATSTDVAITASVKKVTTVAGAISIGTTLAATQLGPIYARAVSLAIDTLLSAVNSVSMWSDKGIDKVGNQDVGVFNWITITGYAPRSGYESTVIEGDSGILIPAGTSVTVTMQQARGENSSIQGRMVDQTGAVLAVAALSGGYLKATYSFTPSVDTIVSQQGYTSSGLGQRKIVVGGPNTFLIVTKN